MKNALSKGILAGALILAPSITRGDEPAATQSDNHSYREQIIQRIRLREELLERVAAERDANAAQAVEQRKKVQALTGLVEVTPEAIRQIISHLQAQREELELDSAGGEGRQRALEEALAALSARLKTETPEDAVVTALQKVVDVRQAQLQRVQALYKSAAVPNSEVEAAEASLATAQAEVAAAKQKAASGSEAAPLAAWNRELLELRISAAERKARLTLINKRLDNFSNALQAVDEMEQQRARLDSLQANRNEMEKELRDEKERAVIDPRPAPRSDAKGHE